VLAGQENRITLCGIDRWLGGTHVRAGNVWQWDDERQQVRL
jgi:hypothetical protein